MLAKVDRRRMLLETVVEASNVLNRVNLKNFVGNPSSPFFGQTTSPLDASRCECGFGFDNTANGVRAIPHFTEGSKVFKLSPQ